MIWRNAKYTEVLAAPTGAFKLLLILKRERGWFNAPCSSFWFTCGKKIWDLQTVLLTKLHDMKTGTASSSEGCSLCFLIGIAQCLTWEKFKIITNNNENFLTVTSFS